MPGTSPPPLPDYERPPVIEVVCGVQFAELKGFQPTAFGLLWQRFRDEYPTCEQQPPLAQVIERLGEPVADEPPRLSHVLPLPRVFFIQETPCWLLQVQNDRLLHNWRKTNETDDYPRFPEVQKRFWSAWERFLGFCSDEGIGDPAVNQLELTYINHIVQGEGWEGLGSIGDVLPDLTWRPKRNFLPSPESILWKASFLLPNGAGRLHLSVRHAIRKSDQKPVLLCELTARGMPTAAAEGGMREWFSLGREWIVRGFADLTADTIQKDIWRRKS